MNPLRYYLPFTGYAYRGELSGCPVCTEKDSRPVAQLDRNWKRLPTVMCNHCGVLYTNPLPTESELGRFYKESYRRLYHRTLRRPRIKHIAKAAKIAQSRVKLTSGMCQPGGRVLDFGCGTGAFVEKMLEAGYDAHGFEIGDSYGGYAREQVGNRIQISDWRQMHYSQEFDLITAFHVVEHLRDPLGAVKKMKSWLAPGGQIFLAVPNLAALPNKGFGWFHFAHVLGFNHWNLLLLGARAGLDPVMVSNPTEIAFKVKPGGGQAVGQAELARKARELAFMRFVSANAYRTYLRYNWGKLSRRLFSDQNTASER